MKKLFASLLAFSVFASLALPAFASTTAPGNPQRLQWTRSGTYAAATSFQDTITIVSAADSVRTSNIDARNWDWGILKSSSVSSSPMAVAKIEVWSDPGNSSTLNNGDSLNFVIEPSFDGGVTYIPNNQAKALAMGASLTGNCVVMAFQNGAGVGGANGCYGSGFLCVDQDAAPIASTTANFYPTLLRDFRLKVFGDAGAIGPIHIQIIPLRTVN